MNKELTEKQRTVIGVFLLTVMGAFIGWVYEELFYRIDLGYFIKRGHGFGPWLPIYAFGALGLILIIIKCKKRIHPAILFIVSVVGSGIIEYSTGWVLYNLMGGVRLWDYNAEIWNWGNIDGFVCARSVLIFGVFGTIFGALIIPEFMQFVKRAKARPLMIFSLVLAVIVGADVIYGYIINPIMKGGL
ncbi:MAG: putative ABC transporter permease [Lachnospiraceae bacterium]|nr:putative ABC transporter permease [Lachnospiraceae bacterium]